MLGSLIVPDATSSATSWSCSAAVVLPLPPAVGQRCQASDRELA
jgi:hypothetical protein